LILYHASNDRLVDQCQPSLAPKRLRFTFERGGAGHVSLDGFTQRSSYSL
jgi:hypothetical protein